MLDHDEPGEVMTYALHRATRNRLRPHPGRDDPHVWYATCPVHRDAKVRYDQDVTGDVWVHPCPRGCLAYETLRQLGITNDRVRPYVHPSNRQKIREAARVAGQRFRAGWDPTVATGQERYDRFVSQLHQRTRRDRYDCPSCGAVGDGHGLKVDLDGERILFHCFSCGGGDEILTALGLTWTDVYGATPKVVEHLEPLPEKPTADVPPEPDQPPRIALVKMSGVKRERIDWLWPGYLARGKPHVIDGDPGLGKSTAMVDWAARVTTGKSWPDGQAGRDPAGVVLLSAEDGLGDTIRPRLEAAGADLDRVGALTGIRTYDEETGEVYERLPALPGDVGRIREAIERVGAALVVIDPLMAYLGPEVNSHRDQDVRRALAPLAKVAEETGAAIILIRHNTKSGGNNALYRGGGSIGIIGAARIGFAFARDPEDEGRVIVACTKANITVMPPSLAYRLVESPDFGCARVEWHDGPVPYSADDLLSASQESAEDREDRNDAKSWLRAYLLDNGGEAPAEEVFKAGKKAGYQERTLQRAKKRAGARSEKSDFDAGWMWRLVTEGDTKMPKATGPGTLSPSSPSVSPSCRVCGEPIDPASGDIHPNCERTTP